MVKFMLMIVTLQTFIQLQVQSIGFVSTYSYQVRANNSLPISSNLRNSKNNANSNNGRMFGIDTGNSDTDQEAGMWLFALLGTLAAAVPVAFLSPNLGFKKRSVSENALWDILGEQSNRSVIINATTTAGARRFDY